MRRRLKKARRVGAPPTDSNLLAVSVSVNRHSLPPDVHLLLRKQEIFKRILGHSKASKKRINFTPRSM